MTGHIPSGKNGGFLETEIVIQLKNMRRPLSAEGSVTHEEPDVHVSLPVQAFPYKRLFRSPAIAVGLGIGLGLGMGIGLGLGMGWGYGIGLAFATTLRCGV